MQAKWRLAERELARIVTEQEEKPAPMVELVLAWNSSPLSTTRSPYGARRAGVT
ncbi:hypothetical protein [Ferrimicrobium acidiphilum]|uniref:hypothetical protein n=1 Tax=Ferrimicrobium acidiphilum TaxID=121039 RepID=UPI001364CB87|nr:hypothetical protein [Ferrimicrobium acidiphilum]